VVGHGKWAHRAAIFIERKGDIIGPFEFQGVFR
jgi:hypothetical protein